MTENSSEMYCSTMSLQIGEDLFATATRADYYLLLEYTGAWGAKAFEESDLPTEVKTHLSTVVKELPNSKVLLIRSKPGSNPSRTFHFFVASVKEENPVLHAFQLETYGDLTALDIESILSDNLKYKAYRYTEPLFLVCTNGRRDACCAQFGPAVHDRLASIVGNAAWQSTHLGGHRFAANLMCFPTGMFFGRLRPEDVDSVVSAYQNDRVYLEKYRGRACYSGPVQAAEMYLRRQTGILGLQAFHLHDEKSISHQRSQIRFECIETKQNYSLNIEVDETNIQYFQSCKHDKLVPLIHYHIVD
jgi:hypothetical protein